MLNENSTLAEVIEALNEGATTVEIASLLSIPVNVLEGKIANAAIVLDEKQNVWMYIGEDENRSLGRKVKSKIVKLNADKPFISSDVENEKIKLENDYEYLLFIDCRGYKWENLSAKKSFHLEPALYDIIKEVSIDKSIKINVLVNNLLKKGLKHYRLI